MTPSGGVAEWLEQSFVITGPALAIIMPILLIGAFVYLFYSNRRHKD
jgi:hypothetical protein